MYTRFETALFLQDACNIRAIARELVKAADEAAEQGKGNFAADNDPAVILIVNKLESMVHSNWNDRYSRAYEQCRNSVSKIICPNCEGGGCSSCLKD